MVVGFALPDCSMDSNPSRKAGPAAWKWGGRCVGGAGGASGEDVQGLMPWCAGEGQGLQCVLRELRGSGWGVAGANDPSLWRFQGSPMARMAGFSPSCVSIGVPRQHCHQILPDSVNRPRGPAQMPSLPWGSGPFSVKGRLGLRLGCASWRLLVLWLCSLGLRMPPSIWCRLARPAP